MGNNKTNKNMTELTEEEAASIMTADEKREAEAFGKSPDLLEQIAKDFSLLGVVGEVCNCILAYIVMISRFLPDPLAFMTISSSGSGKSHLQTITLRFAPVEDVVKASSLTKRALYYKGQEGLKHKILAIEELDGIEDLYAIRTLISEKHLTREVAMGMRTITVTLKGPTAIFMSTTNPEVEPETKSRFIVASIDESKDQTLRILKKQRRECTLEVISQKTNIPSILLKHQNFQRLLKKYEVVNPYANKLTYGDDRLQARRDQPKFLNLCKAMAFLRQMQKEVKIYDDGSKSFEYIEVDEEDIKKVTEIVLDVLGNSLDDLSNPARDLLKQLDESAPRKSERFGFKFTRREIMEKTGRSKTWVHKHLKELLDMELVVKDSGKQGGVQHYKLLYDSEIHQNRFVIGLNVQ